jgi:hypothetical protein
MGRRSLLDLRRALSRGGLNIRIRAVFRVVSVNYSESFEAVAIVILIVADLDSGVTLTRDDIAMIATAGLVVAAVFARWTCSWIRGSLKRVPKLMELKSDDFKIVLTSLFVAELTTAPFLMGILRSLALPFATVQLAYAAKMATKSMCRRKAILDEAHEPTADRMRFRLRAVHARPAMWAARSLLGMSVMFGARAATLMPTIGLVGQMGVTVIAVVHAAPQHTQQPVIALVPVVTDPLPAKSAPSWSLGSNGYAALCGRLNTQQPGWRLDKSMAALARQLWIGPSGFGGAFDGCWSRPEIVRLPENLIVAYDAGSLHGRTVSIAVIPSTGIPAIYLSDGGRMNMVESLLTEGLLVGGSTRFSVGSGDIQLAYTERGTFASIRQLTHPPGDPNESMNGVLLSPVVTTGWTKAMALTHEFLWPIDTQGTTECPHEIEFVNQGHATVGRMCATDRSSADLSLRIADRWATFSITSILSALAPSEVLRYADAR